MKLLASRERVLTTFRHEEPDHVPCWLDASPEWKALAQDYLALPDEEALLHYWGAVFLLPETPVENVIVVYETIRDYGGYH